MNNIDIRRKAASRGVKMWEIADALGKRDSCFSRMLRKELPPKMKEQIFEIIERLANDADEQFAIIAGKATEATKEEKCQVRDHPDIEKLMRTGETGSGKYPHCPICGAECETLFRDKSGVVFACDECVEKQDAWESEEAFF